VCSEATLSADAGVPQSIAQAAARTIRQPANMIGPF
jgi:hypothetical protein